MAMVSPYILSFSPPLSLSVWGAPGLRQTEHILQAGEILAHFRLNVVHCLRAVHVAPEFEQIHLPYRVDARRTACARVSVPSGLRRAFFFGMRAHIQSCAPCARSHYAC